MEDNKFYEVSKVSDIIFVETNIGGIIETKKGVIINNRVEISEGNNFSFNGDVYKVDTKPDVISYGPSGWVKVTFRTKNH
jgi:hypothetical protein